MFEIVACVGDIERFAKSPVRSNAPNRLRAAKWIEGLPVGGEQNPYLLREVLTPSYDSAHAGQRVFEALPDTFMLVVGPVDSKELDDATWFDVWNAPCDAVLHIRMVATAGNMALADAAQRSGGTYVLEE
jgi:hypothetical protein